MLYNMQYYVNRTFTVLLAHSLLLSYRSVDCTRSGIGFIANGCQPFRDNSTYVDWSLKTRNNIRDDSNQIFLKTERNCTHITA